MTDTLKAILIGLKKSPQHLVTIAIVGGFLWYLCRKDDLNMEAKKQVDLVSEQRIKHCHAVQERSTQVMERLNATLTNHDKAFTHLLYKLDTFIDKMDKTHVKMDALMAKMALLERHMMEHQKPHKDIHKVLEQIMNELKNINESIKE